jgi:excisionase family DNA binding protein
MLNENQFVKPREAAKILDINLKTLYVMMNQKIIPAVKFGGRWRLDKLELLQLLKNGTKSNAQR